MHVPIEVQNIICERISYSLPLPSLNPQKHSTHLGIRTFFSFPSFKESNGVSQPINYLLLEAQTCNFVRQLNRKLAIAIFLQKRSGSLKFLTDHAT